MSRAAQMLETYPGEIRFDAKALAECIASCLECAQTCTACADACLAEDRVAELRSCITHNANCADVCDTMTRMLLRMNGMDPQVMMSMMQTTIVMCRACSAECMMHAEMSEHCRMCAMACDQAVMAMEKMMSAMSEAMPMA